MHVYEFVCLDSSWLEQMAHIEQRAQISPWSCEGLESSMSSGAHVYGLHDPKNSILLAFILVGFLIDEAEILTFSVDCSYQRQGLGKKLLLETCRILKLACIRSLFLEVRQTNIAAIALYQQVGFEIIGRRKDYYQLKQATSHESSQPSFEDALVMKCIFSDDEISL